MVPRPFWQRLIEDAWRRRPIVWLTGVRRVGKTTLCQSLERTTYFDCELPSVRREMEDPESFLRAQQGQSIDGGYGRLGSHTASGVAHAAFRWTVRGRLRRFN